MALEAAMTSGKAGLRECPLCVLTKTPNPVSAEQLGRALKAETAPKL